MAPAPHARGAAQVWRGGAELSISERVCARARAFSLKLSVGDSCFQRQHRGCDEPLEKAKDKIGPEFHAMRLAPLPQSENPVVAIYSSAFDVVLERVKAGGLGLKEYGSGMFLANDPSGNVVEVVRLQD